MQLKNRNSYLQRSSGLKPTQTMITKHTDIEAEAANTIGKQKNRSGV